MKDYLSLTELERNAFLKEKSDLYDAPVLFYSKDGNFIWGERAHMSFERVLVVEHDKVLILDLEKTIEYVNSQIYKVIEKD